jgi:hypothetical protein
MAAVLAAGMTAFIAAPSQAQTAAPSQAQTAAPQVRPAPVRAAVVVRPPARVTVRKRSYLDPGTETKRRAEHYSDYALPSPEYGFAPFRYSTMFKNGPALPFFHDRMPFPTCLDLAGFCQ